MGNWMKKGVTNLVLDEELDTLDGGSSGLGDSGGDTTHCDSVSIWSISDEPEMFPVRDWKLETWHILMKSTTKPCGKFC